MIQPKSTRKPIPVLVLAVLLGACGRTSEEPVGPTFDLSSLDACLLFPVQEAVAYAGGSVAPMSSTLEDGSQRNLLVCSYNAGNTDHPRLLKLEIRSSATPQAAARQIEVNRGLLTRLSGGEIQEVPGVGEKALFAGGDLHQLHVLRGNLLLVISAQTDNAPKSLYIAKLIAQRALGRLPPPQTDRKAP